MSIHLFLIFLRIARLAQMVYYFKLLFIVQIFCSLKFPLSVKSGLIKDEEIAV